MSSQKFRRLFDVIVIKQIRVDVHVWEINAWQFDKLIG